MQILPYEQWVVRCPINHQLIEVGDCADHCYYYDGDGKDEGGVPCNYKKDD